LFIALNCYWQLLNCWMIYVPPLFDHFLILLYCWLKLVFESHLNLNLNFIECQPMHVFFPCMVVLKSGICLNCNLCCILNLRCQFKMNLWSLIDSLLIILLLSLTLMPSYQVSWKLLCLVLGLSFDYLSSVLDWRWTICCWVLD
jgi:hypothetical protein